MATRQAKNLKLAFFFSFLFYISESVIITKGLIEIVIFDVFNPPTCVLQTHLKTKGDTSGKSDQNRIIQKSFADIQNIFLIGFRPLDLRARLLHASFKPLQPALNSTLVCYEPRFLSSYLSVLWQIIIMHQSCYIVVYSIVGFSNKTTSFQLQNSI